MTASALKQDPNTWKVKKKAVYFDETQHASDGNCWKNGINLQVKWSNHGGIVGCCLISREEKIVLLTVFWLPKDAGACFGYVQRAYICVCVRLWCKELKFASESSFQLIRENIFCYGYDGKITFFKYCSGTIICAGMQLMFWSFSFSWTTVVRRCSCRNTTVQKLSPRLFAHVLFF